MSKKTVVFDFDGVIHKYSKGWQDGSIYDSPVPGIWAVISKLRDYGYRVVVVSTRCQTQGGIEAIRKWLSSYGIVVDDICATKPPAIVYIDDRAICFDGDANTLIDKIVNFKTWVQKEQENNANKLF